jgi:hypothetical protein
MEQMAVTTNGIIQRMAARLRITGNEALDMIIVGGATALVSSWVPKLLTQASNLAWTAVARCWSWLTRPVDPAVRKLEDMFARRTSMYEITAYMYPPHTPQNGSPNFVSKIPCNAIEYVRIMSETFITAQANGMTTHNHAKIFWKVLRDIRYSGVPDEVFLPQNERFIAYDVDEDLGVHGTLWASRRTGMWRFEVDFWSKNKTHQELQIYISEKVTAMLHNKGGLTLPKLITTSVSKVPGAKDVGLVFQTQDLNIGPEIPCNFDELILTEEAANVLETLCKRLKAGYPQTLLLFGVPGSGKTTCIRFLAKYLRRHVLLPTYEHMMDSKSLERVFHTSVDNSGRSYFQENKIVALEEFDKKWYTMLQRVKPRTSSSSSADKPSYKPSLEDWLMLLGGYYDRSGQLIVLTSNNVPEDLDEAAMRHGRIDAIIGFGYLKARLLPKAIVRCVANLLPDSTSLEVADEEDPKELLEKKVKTFIEEHHVSDKQLASRKVSISRVNEACSKYFYFDDLLQNLESMLNDLVFPRLKAKRSSTTRGHSECLPSNRSIVYT